MAPTQTATKSSASSRPSAWAPATPSRSPSRPAASRRPRRRAQRRPAAHHRRDRRQFAQTVATGELGCTVMTMTPPRPVWLRPHRAGRGRLRSSASSSRRTARPSRPPLRECNAGCYAFDGALLAAHIDEVGNDNAQGEYYLPDMLEILKGHGQRRLHLPLRRLPRGPGRELAASSSRSSPPSRATASTST